MEALSQRPSAFSALTSPTPSSAGAASTIYVSPAVSAPSQHRQPRHANPIVQLDAVGVTLRRGPRRAVRAEIGAVAEESPVGWAPGSAAKPVGADRNGHGPSPGLGASPDDRDSSTASPTASTGPARKKQKRNKPTLSCFECVERKTKVCLCSFLLTNPRIAPRQGKMTPSHSLAHLHLLLDMTSLNLVLFDAPRSISLDYPSLEALAENTCALDQWNFRN